MRFKIFIVTGLGLFFSMSVHAILVNQSRLQKHVRFLSSDHLEGRLTGSIGEKRATEYIANLFLLSGLEPAGDKGTFFQAFNFTAGVSLGKNNSFSITRQNGKINHLKLGQQWQPLAFSDNRSFAITTLIFAGYGIKAPALDKLPLYDSYQGLDVKNKWVIVFCDVPEKISDKQSRQLRPYASPRYKAFTAKEQGATGIIFVNQPGSQNKNKLLPFSFDTSLSGSGIVALSVKNEAVDSWLATSHHPFNSLQKLQDNLDSGQTLPSSLASSIKINGQTDIEKKRQQGRNVLARLKISPSRTSPVLVIGAHVDHLGHGELSGSRRLSDEKGMIHAGADDNASGVASVLEVAARLSYLKAHGQLSGNKDILFAAWSGEEFGILGSSHFVSNAMKHTQTDTLRPAIEAVINLDMIGHLREKLVLQGVGSSSAWPRIIKQSKNTQLLPTILQDDPYLPTDSTAFYLHGVPGLNFFTGAHDDYHTPRDKPETLNYRGIKRISEFLINLILVLEKTPLMMNYQKVQKPTNDSEQIRKIYLGTIPDYTSSDQTGVKLSGVAKNSPADLAGLRQNDVIIELAGKTIHDIYDYTFILNALQVGKPARLVVLRRQQKLVLSIVAQFRV